MWRKRCCLSCLFALYLYSLILVGGKQKRKREILIVRLSSRRRRSVSTAKPIGPCRASTFTLFGSGGSSATTLSAYWTRCRPRTARRSTLTCASSTGGNTSATTSLVLASISWRIRARLQRLESSSKGFWNLQAIKRQETIVYLSFYCFRFYLLQKATQTILLLLLVFIGFRLFSWIFGGALLAT